MKRSQQIVYCVNRSTQPLDCMHDGVPFVLRPGYVEAPDLDENGQQRVDPTTRQPAFKIIGAAPGGQVLTEAVILGAALRARRQHPVMGTEDPDLMNSSESLVAIPALGHDYSHIEQTDAPERFNRRDMLQPGQKAVLVTRRRKLPKVGQSGLTRGSVYLPELWNPAGIDTSTGLRR
jgi:hypothetical protein